MIRYRTLHFYYMYGYFDTVITFAACVVSFLYRATGVYFVFGITKPILLLKMLGKLPRTKEVKSMYNNYYITNTITDIHTHINVYILSVYMYLHVCVHVPCTGMQAIIIQD